ncbi:hypothetical protein ABPG74_014762 [Tetrahymena malaccensis]
MGSVSSNSSGTEDLGGLQNIPQNIRQFELKVDLNKDVHPTLRQLLFWSLNDIRQVYEKFQRRSNIPFLDITLFCKIVPFTRTNAMYIFRHFCKQSSLLSVYEFLCVLVITSYTHYINKIHFLYILFDLDCNGGISLNELLIIFKSIIMGYCKLTETELPPYTTLEKFAKLMFLKSDIQADNSLELKEIIEWVEGNGKAMELFARFEPQYKIKESFEIFLHFKRYTEDDAQEMLKMINKANKSEYYHNDIQKIIGGKYGKTSSYMQGTKSFNKQKAQSLPKLLNPGVLTNQAQNPNNSNLPESIEEQIENDIIEKALDSHAKKYGDKELQESKSHFNLPQIMKAQSPKKGISKNIIIIQGNTLTRKQVFSLKEYFDKLAGNNQHINIKEFTKAFQDKPHMKRVTASLFNFLDSDQKGMVSFEQLLVKLYPSLTKNNLKLINTWIKQYIKTFSAENKDLLMEKDEKVIKRKRVLPRTALKRIKEVFNHLDEDQKGYITQEDLKQQFTYGYTTKEIDEIFEKHDKDRDGRLTIDDFIRMILPSDYIIEEKDDQ